MDFEKQEEREPDEFLQIEEPDITDIGEIEEELLLLIENIPIDDFGEDSPPPQGMNTIKRRDLYEKRM